MDTCYISSLTSPSPIPFSLLSLKPHHNHHHYRISSINNNNNNNKTNFRRPKPLSPKPPPPPSPTITTSTPPPSSNPLNSLRISHSTLPSNSSLTPKLRLTRALSPPPPPKLEPKKTKEKEKELQKDETAPPPAIAPVVEVEDKYRQPGKVFVGNLPRWVKKPDVAEYFRQFGEIERVVLIKERDETERNAGFGFVMYWGEREEEKERAAMKAVEFDGVEFHGRVLTVKLDDGRWSKARAEEKERWVEEGGGERKEWSSEWHEERDFDRREFQRVVESRPENWQAVVTAFQKIKKVWWRFCLS